MCLGKIYASLEESSTYLLNIVGIIIEWLSLMDILFTKISSSLVDCLSYILKLRVIHCGKSHFLRAKLWSLWHFTVTLLHKTTKLFKLNCSGKCRVKVFANLIFNEWHLWMTHQIPKRQRRTVTIDHFDYFVYKNIPCWINKSSWADISQ